VEETRRRLAITIQQQQVWRHVGERHLRITAKIPKFNGFLELQSLNINKLGFDPSCGDSRRRMHRSRGHNSNDTQNKKSREGLYMIERILEKRLCDSIGTRRVVVIMGGWTTRRWGNTLTFWRKATSYSASHHSRATEERAQEVAQDLFLRLRHLQRGHQQLHPSRKPQPPRSRTSLGELLHRREAEVQCICRKLRQPTLLAHSASQGDRPHRGG